MSKKNYITVLLLALFVSFTTISCSSDDNNQKTEKESEKDDPKDDPKDGGTDNGKDDDGNTNNNTKTFYAHKVLVEDFTGAWCQYCPLVTHDIKLMNEEYPEKFEAVAIHNEDRFDFDKRLRQRFERSMGVTGYPAAYTNRTTDFREYPNSVKDQHLKSSPIGIKIKADLGLTSGTVDVTLRFSENYSDGLKHTIYILEDGLVEPQSNNTRYYTPNRGWVNDFVHNYTLIGYSDGFEGRLIPNILTKEGKEYKREGVEISYKAENINNLRAVVIVTDVNGKVLNVQSAKGNETKDFVIVE